MSSFMVYPKLMKIKNVSQIEDPQNLLRYAQLVWGSLVRSDMVQPFKPVVL